MSAWFEGPLTAFDVETTGTDAETDRIVTAAVVDIRPGQTVVTDEWLADPGVDIPVEASEIHGVTTEHARRHGRPAADVVAEVSACLYEAWERGGPVVAYNATFDLTMLDREMRRHLGVGLEVGPVVDPLVLDRAMDPYRKGKGSRQLTFVCQNVYGVSLSDQDAHGAAADALAAARVAWKIATRYPRVGGVSLAELQGLQAGWKREQAESLGAWLVRQGKVDDAAREWPLRLMAAGGIG